MPATESLVPREDGARKVAALLITMGKPAADRVLRHFSDSEIKCVVETMASLGVVPRSSLEEFVDEVSAAVERGADVRAGLENVENLLAGIVQPDQLASIIAGVRGEGKRPVWSRLAELPEKTIGQFILNQHPQVGAYILSRISSSIAASVLSQLPSDVRAEFLRRIIAMRPISEHSRHMIEDVLEGSLLAKTAVDAAPAVHTRVANIINRMEKHQIDAVLTDLQERMPNDAKLVKGLLFTFDDIARLSPADRVKLFDGVASDITILALQGAPDHLRDLVLGSLSSRSRRIIEQEVDGASNVPAREIARARRAIADLALQLVERGAMGIAPEDQAGSG